MKTTTYFLAFLLLLAMSAQAQDKYSVTRVNGNVTFAKSGKPVKPGDVLNPNDQVKFENFDAYVISINQKMARFMLKLSPPQANASKQNQALTATVKDIALVTKRRSLMSVRFNPNEKEVTDLKNYFGTEKFSIIGDNVDIALNSTKYPLSDNKFIVFHYKVNSNPVSKKLSFDQQTIKIDKESILTTKAGNVNGNEVSELSVYLYEKSTKASEEITKLTLVFVDKETLRNEFKTILPILKRQKMNDEAIKKYLIEYYYDFYGATDSKTIDTFAGEVVKQVNQ
ncbi:MAG: hypothetical protein EHM93_09390 [Bacteroidales bacterium]|nr:MAG: hypothetical protein EHM93_09390 [Bacteroidales bacterium]